MTKVLRFPCDLARIIKNLADLNQPASFTPYH